MHFFTRQINPRSFGLWCVKGTEESSLEVDSSAPLTHHDPKDLGLICLVKKRTIHFRILSDLRIQSWIFLKKRTLNFALFNVNLEPILAEDKESRDGFAGNKNKEIRITSLSCIEQHHIAVTARRKHLQWPLRV